MYKYISYMSPFIVFLFLREISKIHRKKTEKESGN